MANYQETIAVTPSTSTSAKDIMAVDNGNEGTDYAQIMAGSVTDWINVKPPVSEVVTVTSTAITGNTPIEEIDCDLYNWMALHLIVTVTSGSWYVVVTGYSFDDTEEAFTIAETETLSASDNIFLYVRVSGFKKVKISQLEATAGEATIKAMYRFSI